MTLRERIQRWAKFLGSISIITGALIASWKVVHYFDVRLTVVEARQAQFATNNDELVDEFRAELAGLHTLVDAWKEDTDQLGTRLERLDLELRDAHLAAARAGDEAEAFSELQITHVYAEMDSIENELDRLIFMQNTLFRAVSRLDSTALRNLIGRDTLYIKAPVDSAAVTESSHWWNPFD